MSLRLKKNLNCTIRRSGRIRYNFFVHFHLGVPHRNWYYLVIWPKILAKQEKNEEGMRRIFFAEFEVLSQNTKSLLELVKHPSPQRSPRRAYIWFMSTCALFLDIRIFSPPRTKCPLTFMRFCQVVNRICWPREAGGSSKRARARARPVFEKKGRAEPEIPLKSYFSGACIQFALREAVIRFASLAGEKRE